MGIQKGFLMSRIDKLANQPISDALIDELTDLLYEATIRSSTPRKEIRRIVGDFLEAYVDADTVLCSVCKKTKTIYVRQQWLRVWQQVARRIEQQESANGSMLSRE
jgi:hypothetical protein